MPELPMPITDKVHLEVFKVASLIIQRPLVEVVQGNSCVLSDLISAHGSFPANGNLIYVDWVLKGSFLYLFWPIRLNTASLIDYTDLAISRSRAGSLFN